MASCAFEIRLIPLCRKQQALVWGQLLAAMEAEARVLEAEGKPGMSAAQLAVFTAEVRSLSF